jgi:hypothetical protein
MKPKTKEKLFDVFSVAAFWIGFSIHGWPSLCFLGLGTFCGAFALYLTLLNNRIHGIDRPQARNWSLLLFVVLGIGAGVYWKQCKELEPGPEPPQPPKPHFTLGITLEGSRKEPTWLTNEDLKMPEGFDPAKFIRWSVVLPELPHAGNVSMSFVLLNDSENSLDSIDGVASFKGDPFIFGPGWQDVMVFGAGEGFSNGIAHIPQLSTRFATNFPTIVFPTPTMNRVIVFDVRGAKIPIIQHPDVIGTMNFSVSANGVRRTHYSFFVEALPTTNINAHPIVVPPMLNLVYSNWDGIDKSKAINIFNSQK